MISLVFADVLRLFPSLDGTFCTDLSMPIHSQANAKLPAAVKVTLSCKLAGIPPLNHGWSSIMAGGPGDQKHTAGSKRNLALALTLEKTELFRVLLRARTQRKHGIIGFTFGIDVSARRRTIQCRDADADSKFFRGPLAMRSRVQRDQLEGRRREGLSRP